MHARSTTFRGDPDDVDAGIAFVREQVMPAVLEMPGCVGLSMLVDRETGGSIVTSAWESVEAMRATALAVAPMRDRAAQLFHSSPEVREWEIAILHRSRPVPAGACARVTWTRVAPSRLQDQLDYFRSALVPQVEDLPGFCSLSLLADPSTGACATATTYESREALERSRKAAADLRESSMDTLSGEVLDVAELEVALAHLRVPETV